MPQFDNILVSPFIAWCRAFCLFKNQFIENRIGLRVQSDGSDSGLLCLCSIKNSCNMDEKVPSKFHECCRFFGSCLH